MSDKSEREQIADQVRQYGGLVAQGAAMLHPIVGAVLQGAVSLGAKLVETLGAGNAIKRLEELADNPVELITPKDLDDQTQSVIDELS